MTECAFAMIFTIFFFYAIIAEECKIVSEVRNFQLEKVSSNEKRTRSHFALFFFSRELRKIFSAKNNAFILRARKSAYWLQSRMKEITPVAISPFIYLRFGILQLMFKTCRLDANVF